jgi:competence protein ComEA
LRVYVTGAVRRPDVYLFPAGSIVKEAIAAAGGATEDADLDRINLAVQLQDQQQVYVPRRGQEASPVLPLVSAPPGGDVDSRSGTVSLVNINAASAVELEALPGIGPTYAQRIVDYRQANGPFAAVEEIMEVKGIGPGTFAKLEGLITVH